MYTIAIDAERNLVRITLAGLMTVEEVIIYMGDLRHTMAKNGVKAGYAVVIDVTACTIQTQDMIHTMGAQMAMMPKARAIAIVLVSALARMQVRRLFQQSYARIVPTLDDGLAWVLDGREPLADAACGAAA